MAKNNKNSSGSILEGFVAFFMLIYIVIQMFLYCIIFIINCFKVCINIILFIINLFIRNKSKKIKYLHIISTNGVSDNIQMSNQILSEFDVSNQKEEPDKVIDEKLEKEMDAYELEEWQKELVREGKYNPNNFEEDGKLEDEDYYYEDEQ